VRDPYGSVYKQGMQLSAVEMWELGQAILGDEDRKVSGRFELEWGAGDGLSGYGYKIPSKAGKICLGDAEAPASAKVIAAAPGSAANLLFTLNGENFNMHGLRLRASAPVIWRIQAPIALKRSATPGLWTHGMKTRGSQYTYNELGTARLLHCKWGDRKHLHWALGLDAKDRSACILFAFIDATLFSEIDGQTLAPTEHELAALRMEPHRHAIPADDLAALASAIQRETKRKLSASTAWQKAWREVKNVPLQVAGTESNVVPSVKGKLALGNITNPASAVRVALGGTTHNRAVRISINTQSRFGHGSFTGLALSNEVAVRWKVEGELAAGAAQSTDDKQAMVALWSPGCERSAAPFKAPERWRYYEQARGVLVFQVPANVPLVWLVGYDARDTPAVVLVGERWLVPYFDHGLAGVADVKAAAKRSKQKLAAVTAERAAVSAEIDAENGYPLPPATATELAAIAEAIAAGPAKKQKITKRFSLAWDATRIAAIKGELEVGDPDGASFSLAAGTSGPKATFQFFDGRDENAGAWGRTIVGLQLGTSKAVTWKPSYGIGVDSGRYGAWTPGRPKAAKIVQTSEGDCSFPSLLGLDANQKPVAFLFGEAVRLEVFGDV